MNETVSALNFLETGIVDIELREKGAYSILSTDLALCRLHFVISDFRP